ncbi:MAG: PaaI family thioesterase [Burkholderiaceae bacterium]|nr:PaaI family thioesterase [Burkholderiaceae bacterium]
MSHTDTAAEAEAPDKGLPAPAGFEPFDFYSPYFNQLGTVYRRDAGDGELVLGIRVAPLHSNFQQVAHGGMLVTFADGALAGCLSLARGRRGAQMTVSLSTDFLSAARIGDWLEAHARVTRLGRRLGFAEAALKVGEKIVLRASGVFAVVDRNG